MLNRVILMGRLTADPDYRTTQSGATLARFTLAVDRIIPVRVRIVKPIFWM